MQFSSNCPPYSLIKCYYHCMISFVFFFSKWNFIWKLGKIVRLVVGIPRYMVLIMGMLFLLLSKSLWFVFFLVVIAIHRWALHQVDIKMSFFLVILVRNLHKTTSWICCLGRVYSRLQTLSISLGLNNLQQLGLKNCIVLNYIVK